MSTGAVAWIRRYWVIAIAAVYLLAHLLIWLLWRAVGPPYAPTTSLEQESAWMFYGFPVFAGTFLGLRLLLSSQRRGLGLALTVAALLVQAGTVYLNLYVATSRGLIDDRQSIGATNAPRIAKLPDRAMEVKNGRGGQRAAQWYFRETGIPVPYRDDAGETRRFEPTAEDTAMWEKTRERNEEVEELRSTFEGLTATFRFRAYSNVALGALAILLALAIPWWRRKPAPAPAGEPAG